MEDRQRHDVTEGTCLISSEMRVYSATEGVENGLRRPTSSSYAACESCSATTDNLLVLFELQQLKQLSNINLVLCILSLFYVAVNIVGLDWNGHNLRFRNADEVPMHLLEFWATLCFALVEVCSLVYSPKSLTSIARSKNTTLVKFVVFLNVGTAATAATLYTLDPVVNEVPSHEIEYTNAICVAFIDFLFIRGLLPNVAPREGHDQDDPDGHDPMWDRMSQAFITLALMYAVATLCVYNINADGNGEQDSHWMEVSLLAPGLPRLP